jgi:hypothetical protein
MKAMLKKMKMPAPKAAPKPAADDMELMVEDAEEADGEGAADTEYSVPQATTGAGKLSDEALLAEMKRRGLSLDGAAEEGAEDLEALDV